jgi:hypothetical protein
MPLPGGFEAELKRAHERQHPAQMPQQGAEALVEGAKSG